MSITAEEVKAFLRDSPEENFLTDEEDFPPDLIERAISFVVNDFNSIPVFTSVSAATFPFRNILLLGVSAWLLESLAIKHARNHLSYSVAGVSVDDQNKAEIYSAMAQNMQAKYEAKSRSAKNQMNLDEGFSSVPSEYASLRRR